jgi:hypothetical protein
MEYDLRISKIETKPNEISDHIKEKLSNCINKSPLKGSGIEDIPQYPTTHSIRLFQYSCKHEQQTTQHTDPAGHD